MKEKEYDNLKIGDRIFRYIENRNYKYNNILYKGVFSHRITKIFSDNFIEVDNKYKYSKYYVTKIMFKEPIDAVVQEYKFTRSKKIKEDYKEIFEIFPEKFIICF